MPARMHSMLASTPQQKLQCVLGTPEHSTQTLRLSKQNVGGSITCESGVNFVVQALFEGKQRRNQCTMKGLMVVAGASGEVTTTRSTHSTSSCAQRPDAHRHTVSDQRLTNSLNRTLACTSVCTNRLVPYSSLPLLPLPEPSACCIMVLCRSCLLRGAACPAAPGPHRLPSRVHLHTCAQGMHFISLRGGALPVHIHTGLCHQLQHQVQRFSAGQFCLGYSFRKRGASLTWLQLRTGCSRGSIFTLRSCAGHAQGPCLYEVREIDTQCCVVSILTTSKF